LKISIKPVNFLCLLWNYTTATTKPIAATPAISANVNIQSRRVKYSFGLWPNHIEVL
jgi:hypothetical protein